MGENSKIAWTDHTFNPWWGCARVSEGCKNCYAETFAARFGVKWGATSQRRFFGEKHWNDPRKWNAAAQKAGIRARVFCASMADVFDAAPGLDDERSKLWKLIAETPWLDWLLLTKRPENIRPMLPIIQIGGAELPRFNNVWLGTTVENQPAAESRILWLLEAPSAVRFLSIEPMISAVDLERVQIVAPSPPHGPGAYLNALTGHVAGPDDMGPKVDWVIVGGESGHKARPFHVEWARSIQAQCKAAGVAFFMKQMGAHLLVRNDDSFNGDDDSAWPVPAYDQITFDPKP